MDKFDKWFIIIGLVFAVAILFLSLLSIALAFQQAIGYGG